MPHTWQISWRACVFWNYSSILILPHLDIVLCLHFIHAAVERDQIHGFSAGRLWGFEKLGMCPSKNSLLCLVSNSPVAMESCYRASERAPGETCKSLRVPEITLLVCFEHMCLWKDSVRIQCYKLLGVSTLWTLCGLQPAWLQNRVLVLLFCKSLKSSLLLILQGYAADNEYDEVWVLFCIWAESLNQFQLED